ncbi:MAG: hypothetical protein AAF213_08885 [Pseudomonadota bacterium]
MKRWARDVGAYAVMLVVALTLGMAPSLAAEFDLQQTGRSIPDDPNPMGGRGLVMEELATLLINDTTEVGKIVNASKRDFAEDGVVYKLTYSRTKTDELAGTLAYSDGVLGRQVGHFLMLAHGTEPEGPGRLCRAPAMQDMTRRCFHVFAVDENLYEARSIPSNLVRFRFRVFDIEQILSQ